MEAPNEHLAKVLPTQLAQGIDKLGLEISANKQELLLNYLYLLIKWNKAFNLSGIKDPEQMLRLHVLDSLSVLPFIIDAQVILDVGTGAGLPGFLLAICCPEKKFILLDSNGKKTRFMFQTAAALGLSNIQVVNGRAEDFQSAEQIDIVLSRAFTSLKQFVSWTQHLLQDTSKLLAMKGLYPEDEVAELPETFRVSNSHILQVPGEAGERHLLEIKQNIDCVTG